MLPYIIDYHTPKLDQFLKPGTEFTLDELFSIHKSLKDLHLFVESIQIELDREQAPTLVKLTQLILQKNAKLMGQIFALMMKANANHQRIVLSTEDLAKIQDLMVSPKDIYLQIAGTAAKEKQDLNKSSDDY